MAKTPSLLRPDARRMRVALLRSSFNEEIVGGLVEAARAALREMGAGEVTVLDVPGAFELPLAARAAAGSGRFDVLVALGAVIRGETDHYEHIAREAATGLAAASRETGVPVGFGVLTVADESQARSRSAPGPDNKGAEAARAAVSMALLLRSLRTGPHSKPRNHKGTKDTKKEKKEKKGNARQEPSAPKERKAGNRSKARGQEPGRRR